MKKSTLLLSFLISFIYLLTDHNAEAQPRIDFNGLWRTSDGVLIHVKDTASTFTARYINSGDCAAGRNCPLGGGGEYFLKGTVGSNNKMDLTMLRCTHKKAMRDFGLAPRWTAPVKITAVKEKSISGSSRIEWYTHEVINGIETNFKRDASQDYDSPFSLTRTNCKKELEELAAEINQKAESLKEQARAIEDVDKSFDDAIQRYSNEIDEQIHEEVFDVAVPAPVRLATVDYSDDPAGHITTWADLIEDFAESTGRLVLQKMAKVVGVADMLIDLGNINAKGITVLDETGQINKGLEEMRNRREETFHSWANAMEAYQRLSALCEAEIPKEQQPKPTGSILSSSQAEEINHGNSEAKKMHAGIGKDIESAKTEITNASAAIEKFAMFLEPYRNADKNKTLKQVMGDAGIATFKSLLIEMGKSWLAFLRSLNNINQNMKKLRALPAPAVG